MTTRPPAAFKGLGRSRCSLRPPEGLFLAPNLRLLAADGEPDVYGTPAHQLSPDRPEIEAVGSPLGRARHAHLFRGRAHQSYFMRAYAPVGVEGEAAVGIIAVEGAADLFQDLNGYRRWLWGAGAISPLRAWPRYSPFSSSRYCAAFQARRGCGSHRAGQYEGRDSVSPTGP